MRSRRFIALVGCAVAASTLSVGIAGQSAGASGHAAFSLRGPSGGHLAAKHVLLDWDAPHSQAARAALASPLAPATTIKTFSHNINDGGTPFTTQIVGKNVFTTLATPGTGITTDLVPLRLNFNSFGNSFDPTVGDNCDPSSTPTLTRTQNSPIFKAHNYTFDGSSTGSLQYVDAFQRAEFNQYTNAGGINPNYHVRLKLVNIPKVTINLTGFAEASGAACGNGHLGAIEINTFDNYVQTTLIPSLAGAGVGSTTFPIFLVHNVIWYIGTTSNCCVIGYHNSYIDGNGHKQTYAVADFDDSTFFNASAVHDVSALSHEVGEWMNDPFVNNATKPWGHIGQVSGCQNNFEVGDPLSGTLMTVNMGSPAYAYHPQEMAFFSWFYHQSPSIGLHGKYSNNGTFTSFAAVCT